MTDLWVARDADGTLCEFEVMPILGGGVWAAPYGSNSKFRRLPSSDHPDLKPGECRRLVLAEEKSA